MSLIRLSYVSRATFKPYTVNGMDQQVAGILSQSRLNNQRRNLVGALYYANGVFFQCLEGEEEAIDELLAKLQEDTRHTDLRVLSRMPIQERQFQDWEMKFAMLDHEIRHFLRDKGLAKFDPYKFTHAMTEELVSLLLAAQDVDRDRLEGAVAPQPSSSSRLHHHPLFLMMAGGLAVAAMVGIFGF